jgi:hypothetical protein
MVAGRVAGRDRHDRQADALGAVVEAEPAREETVTEGDVQHVAGTGAGRHHDAGHTSRHTSRSPAV